MKEPKLFDLEAAKRGEPIMRKDGNIVRFIAHVPDADYNERVVVLNTNNKILLYPEDGRHTAWGADSVLVMAPRKYRANQYFCIPLVPQGEEDWTEWVAPAMRSYMMQCCDCGLVHELQFEVKQAVHVFPDGTWEGVPCSGDFRVLFRARRAQENHNA